MSFMSQIMFLVRIYRQEIKILSSAENLVTTAGVLACLDKGIK